MGGLEPHRWRNKSQQKKEEEKIDLWKRRGGTFPDLGGVCLEVKGLGHMAPGHALFHQLFFLFSVGVTKRVGTGNQRAVLRGFVVVLFVFSIF